MKKVFINAMLFAALGISLSSCLKDKGFEDGQYGINDPDDSPVAVAFPWAYNPDPRILSVEVRNSPQNVTGPSVLLAADQPADRDIKVTLVPNQSLVADWNANPDNDPLTTFPAGAYQIPSLTVTIPKGSRFANLPIVIPSTNGLSFSDIYGLGFTISSVDQPGVVIAENLKNIIIGINVANQYAGDYNVTGYFFHPTASRAIEDTKTLGTKSDVGCIAPHSDLYPANYYFDFDVSPTNTLINYASRGATPPPPSSGFMTADNPGGIAFLGDEQPGQGEWRHSKYNNTYNPATETFLMHYGYGVGSSNQNGWSRQVYEQWVRD